MRENEIYKLIPYLLYDIPYSLPSNASPSLKRQVYLALMAYKNHDYNFENIDRYLEDIDQIDFSLDEATLRDYCVDSVVGIIIQLIDVLKEVIQSSNEVYSLVYFNAMGRLRASFECSIILLRNGYYIESSPVFRLIFEQIAWAYSIIGKDRSEIENSKVTKQINILNELIPNSSAMYGPYSQEAHLEPRKIGTYISIDEELSMVGHRYRSGEKSKEKYHDLFFLARLYCKSIYNFSERLNALDLDSIIQLPDKQINCSIKERLDNAQNSLTIIVNQVRKIDGLEYNENIPGLKIMDDLMV